MNISEIQSYLKTAEINSLLYEEKRFGERADVIDFIDFQVLDLIEDLIKKTHDSSKLILLKQRAEKIKSSLEKTDIKFFRRLHSLIRKNQNPAGSFKNLISEFFDLSPDNNERLEEAGYDNLDIFINRLLSFDSIPDQTIELEPDMVYYQKTPARIVFELVEKAGFTENDVFFDLGSGPGQTAILVNLLAGIQTRGIEYEPAFCSYAKRHTAALALTGVRFIHEDARNADYSEGTVFFLFTPFKGEILREVLEMLRRESLSRKIRIISYGPCSKEIASAYWLHLQNPQEVSMYHPMLFNSKVFN